MNINELAEPFERLLATAVTPAVVRGIDAGAAHDGLWAELLDSGFLDLLLPESAGGAGLSLAEAHPLLTLLGRYAAPLPLAETMAARALLSAAGCTAPAGPTLLLAPERTSHGWWQGGIPCGAQASHALVDDGEQLLLVELHETPLDALGLHASRSANLRWSAMPRHVASLERPAAGLRALAAVLRATAIAGAAEKVLDMSVRYANERVQFGKPIGKQQAVQQQLAVLAERALMARFASAAGCRGNLNPSLLAAATAKQVASAAVPRIVSIAHAVHGAIGITAEFDLQLYTRRLLEWRLADGSEDYWARLLGEARLGAPDVSSLDFIRRSIFAGNEIR